MGVGVSRSYGLWGLQCVGLVVCSVCSVWGYSVSGLKCVRVAVCEGLIFIQSQEGALR